MSEQSAADVVPAGDIERIVGVARHRSVHYGRAVSAEQRVYILHSERCRDSGIDLRECPFSIALDRGLDERDWSAYEDRPVALRVYEGWLIPVKVADHAAREADK